MFDLDPQERISHEDHSEQIKEFLHSNEMLDDPVTRRDYFENLDNEGFIELTQQIASLVRTGDSNHSQAFDGSVDGGAVSLMGHEVPDQREKEALLAKTWETAQEVLHDRNLSDEEALEYAGLTVAGGVLLAHPFMDGNGRTSRVLSYAMVHGVNDDDNLQSIIKNHSAAGGWSIYPSPKYFVPSRRSYPGSHPEVRWEVSEDFGGEEKDAYDGMVVNSLYNNLVMHEFIKEADSETRQLIDEETIEDEKGEKILTANKLLDRLAHSDRAMEYAKKLHAILRREQVIRVERFLDSMKKDVMATASGIKASEQVSLRALHAKLHHDRSSIYDDQEKVA